MRGFSLYKVNRFVNSCFMWKWSLCFDSSFSNKCWEIRGLMIALKRPLMMDGRRFKTYQSAKEIDAKKFRYDKAVFVMALRNT